MRADDIKIKHPTHISASVNKNGRSYNKELCTEWIGCAAAHLQDAQDG